jgi:hypothetical protein
MLGIALAAQLAWHGMQARPSARAEDLGSPPSSAVLRAFSFGDPSFLAYVLLLRLQAFDNQPGISIPFKDLDYAKLSDWLAAGLELDPSSQYALLLASTVYAQVPDEARQRLMLDLVYRSFFSDPERRWSWLAHASVMARHRLNDLPLALKYAQAIAEHGKSPSVPSWARQMHIFLRQEMGEDEAARILLGGLLSSGTVRDPHEVAFLLQRLNELKNAENSPHAPKR